jgi:nitroreductase
MGLEMHETLETIYRRRSIRAYKPDQITDDELQTILKAGQYAPSGMNQQPWHFSVVQKSELIATMNHDIKEGMLHSGNPQLEGWAKAENFNAFYSAPTVIIVSGDESVMTVQYDCTLAMGNMFLAAKSLGIGACWVHAPIYSFQTEESSSILKALAIPAGYKIFSSGVFGYPMQSPDPAPRKEGTVSIIK